MHKCNNCGQEFEGNFCPNCGAGVNEQKTCPNCGATLSDNAKFCNQCGYSFNGENNIKQAKHSNAAVMWIKAHIQVIVAVAVLAIASIVFLSLIPTFKLASKNGTYYHYIPEIDEVTKSSITLKTGKWSDSEGGSGKYTVNGNNVTLYENVFGTQMEVMSGTVSHDVFKVEGGYANSVYVKKSHKHSWGGWTEKSEVGCTTAAKRERICGYCTGKETEVVKEAFGHNGNWKTTKEATCTEDGFKEMRCSRCSSVETEIIPKEHKNNYFIELNTHQKICSRCGKAEAKENHTGAETCTICKFPLQYTRELVFSINENNDSYSVTGLEIQQNTYIRIPETYENHLVTTIESQAFKLKAFTYIYIPESVKSIGDEAFMYCQELRRFIFLGTKEQWRAIEKGENWSFGTVNCSVHCTDGKLDKNGNEIE